MATHQIYLVTFLGLCKSECIERGVRSHLEPCRIRIPNYFCLGTYCWRCRLFLTPNIGQKTYTSVVSLYRVHSLFGRTKAFVLSRIRLRKLACTRYRDTTQKATDAEFVPALIVE